MDDAFDTTRMELVRASDAAHSGLPDRYLCPACQTEVVYAAGDFVVPHFRHRRGGKHEECERYCAVFNKDVPLAAHAREHLDAVLVAGVEEHESVERVHIAVRYRPSYAAEKAEFVQGHRITPFKVHASARQQHFRVVQVEANYVVRGLTPENTWETHVVEGFGEDPAVFRFVTDRESVRLPIHRILRPGMHLVLSKDDLRPRFHADLRCRGVVEPAEGLHGTIITVPDAPSLSVAKNISDLLGFETKGRLAAYAILSPWLVNELATDCWEVDTYADVVVLIRIARELDPRPDRILVQQRCRGKISTAYLRLDDAGKDFTICLDGGKDAAEVVRIALADPPRFVAEIRRSDRMFGSECARLGFELKDGAGGKRCVGWGSHELRVTLTEGSTAAWQVSRVVCPEEIELSVSDAAGRKQRLDHVSAPRALREFLERAHFPCRLHATGVGSRMGYPDIVLPRRGVCEVRATRGQVGVQGRPRTRLEARMQRAYRIGLISDYARGAVAHE